ncbi:MAG: hypothetical protein LBJ75_00480 [Puniceicoccales bacterium]|nr:hypothetical protein [Puniceicoccales bacterium]
MDSIGTNSGNVLSRHNIPPQGQGSSEITVKAMGDGSVGLTSDETCEMVAKPGDQRKAEAVAEKTSTDEVKLQDEAARKDAMDAAWEDANIDIEIDEITDGVSKRTKRLISTTARDEFEVVLRRDPTAFQEAQDVALDVVWRLGLKAVQESAWVKVRFGISKIRREFRQIEDKMAETNLGDPFAICDKIRKEAKNAFDVELKKDPEIVMDVPINAAIGAAWRVAENALVEAMPEAVRAIPGLSPEKQNALVEQLREKVNRMLAEKTPAALFGVLAEVINDIRNVNPETAHI